MAPRVVPLTAAQYAAWDDFVAACPDRTPYHSAAWFEVLRRTFGYRPRGLLLSDGDDILAGLPLFEVPGWSGRRLVSSPFRDRGGVLAAPGADVRPLLRKAAASCRGSCRHLAIKHMARPDGAALRDEGFDQHAHWVTTRVDLRPGADALWRSLGNNARGPVKQARLAGLTVRTGRGAADLDRFHRIFVLNRRALGIPTFPALFFTEIGRRLGDRGAMRLLLAEHDGAAVAGLLLLIAGDTVIDGYAAAIPSRRDLRPNDLLVWTAIEWASQQGYATFDFGADSPHQTGLLAFKRKWHGVHHTLSDYRYSARGRAAPDDDSASGRYAMARRVMSRLPMPLFRWVSRLTVRRLG